LERSDQEVSLLVLDSFASRRDQQAVANAEQAVADGEALAYLGDFHSSQVRETAPILGEAGLLQVAPVATQVGLDGPTLVRITPHDGIGADAIADWLADARVRRVLVVHDHDVGYGVPVGGMCVEAALARDLGVRSRPVWDAHERPADDLNGAEAVVYAGVAGSGAIDLWNDLHAANPDLWLVGTEGLAHDWVARGLQPSTAERIRFFVAATAPLWAYGYEAMALILDSVREASADRSRIVQAARATRDRDSIIGRYSIDPEGHTTTAAYGRLKVVDGQLVSDLSGATLSA
jgi:ABC-type branched-subunit amino acid transport system substrate-binding protein